MKLKDFREQLKEACGINLEEQLVLLMEGDAPKVLNKGPEDDNEEIRKLGVVDNTDILVQKLEEEEVKKRQEEENKNGEAKKEEVIGKTENLVNVLIERDDEEGSIKYCKEKIFSLCIILIFRCGFRMDIGGVIREFEKEDEYSSGVR